MLLFLSVRACALYIIYLYARGGTFRLLYILTQSDYL